MRVSLGKHAFTYIKEVQRCNGCASTSILVIGDNYPVINVVDAKTSNESIQILVTCPICMTTFSAERMPYAEEQSPSEEAWG